MTKTTVSLDQIEQKTVQALTKHGAAAWVAEEVAKAVRVAEMNGNLICGLYYLDSYCTQLRTGRVDGNAAPVVNQPKGAAVKVDAKLGFAQAAFAKGFETAQSVAKEMGSCSFAICHSHTCTSMGFFTEQIANAGFIGIGMTNAPACVSPPGGTKAVLGTNPISMAIPARDGGVAFMFDQSTSAIAIGKIRVAAAAGDKIPVGWAVDKNGEPTDDPNAALEGSLVSAGGYKGYGFGLMAEILAGAVTGSLNSVSAPPLKAPEGQAHDLGQFYLMIDPTTFSGDAFWERLGTLTDAVEGQPGARLPGSNRPTVTEVSIDAALWEKVLELAS
ncbi:Ldh family oxidoreductase [Alphaproteobacteria bacterium]|nr:Ldh family oxidoreductase [Alphaproteobacteria bacterium]